MPLVTVHAALMRTGQLLFFDAWEIPGTPSARLWNPTTGAYTPVPNGFAELFCAGHILTADGRLLTTGGHNGSGVGTTDATAFDPATLQWTALPYLNYARWYPSVTQLADGRAITFGGTISRPAVAEIPEALASGGSAWATFPQGQKDVGEYPHVFQGPDGRVFVNGGDASNPSWLFDANTGSWTLLGAGPAASGAGVMYRPGKVMMAGGGTQGADPVVRATGVIDLNQSSPSWRQTAPMAFGRSQHNLVILPDGKVLVVGGAADVSLVSTNPVLPAEMWDPATETWSQVASMTRPRMYHSIAILLPDGRVLAAGGGRLGPNELNGEFYSPPYLFRGPRPVASSAPASVGFGGAFNVATPNAAAIARVTLVRTSSVTHGINLDQRFFELPFAQASGAVTVQAPSDARVAAAGDYLLFLLDGNGVPSLGRFLRLGGASGTSSLSVNDVSVNEGTSSANSAVFTVTLAGTSAQTVTVNYATADGTATAGNDYLAKSGSLTFPPGAATRTVSVSITPDAVVEPNETFTLNLSNPLNAVIAKGVGIGTIVNDDVPEVPTLSIDSVSVVEGSGSGTPVARFTVTLSAASAQNVVVSYRTVSGTAVSPGDFTSTTGTITFAGGTTVQSIQVPIVPDVIVEPDESFTVELYNPVQALIENGVGTATILDDDSGTVTATYVVAAGADDVNEDGATLTADAGTVWAGTGASAGASYLGLRFTGVSIPAGAAITSARVELSALATQWNAVAFEQAAEASVNSSAFSASARPSQRALLAPRVAHQSNAQWVAGSRYALDDIRTLVQAVVQQPGWAAGQPLTLVLRGTGGAWGRKHAASAEGGSATAPRLVVSYTSAGGPPNLPPGITSVSATPQSGQAPLAVQFAATATDPEGGPLSYTWTFGDGQEGGGAAATHAYAAGTYSATLVVSDGVNQTASVPLTIQATSGAAPALTVNDVTVTEGNSGTTLATFTVTRSAAVGTVSVAYATANGTATAPGDYTPTSGTLTFGGSALTQTVSVPVVGDMEVEPDETFTLLLSNAVGATIADGSGLATILNDDGTGGPVTATYLVATGADDVNEEGASFSSGAGLWVGSGASATGSYLGLRFTGVTIPAGATITSAFLELTASTTQWTAIAFELAAEAAGNSAPFSATTRPSQRTLLVPRVAHTSDVQWTAGTRYGLNNMAPVLQALVDQPAWAAGQALSVIARGTGGAWARKFLAGAEGGAGVAPRLVVTYTTSGDVNQPPSITAATATPQSGAAPLTVAFAGAATDPENAPLTYTWTFGDGTTGTGPNVSHTFAAGAYAATLTASDGTSQAVSGLIAIEAGAAALPALSISDATVTEGNSGTTIATFTVNLSSPPSGTVTVEYATANGTAVAPGDFTARSGILTFNGPTTTQTISVTVVGDTAIEPDETFSVTLSNATNASIARAIGVGTIVNDDAAGPVTATFVVASGGDDVNEDGATFTSAAGQAWVGNGASATASYLGLRFTGVNVPAGATITAAHLELTASGTQWTGIAFEQAAEASTNSVAFSAAARPSQRALLAPRVAHVSNSQWLAGTRYPLDDIRTLVQAVVQQPGWATGQALTLVLRGTGGAWGRKHAGSAEGGSAVAPRLIVTYTLP